jgi:hypothetical protein
LYIHTEIYSPTGAFTKEFDDEIFIEEGETSKFTNSQGVIGVRVGGGGNGSGGFGGEGW